MGTESDKKPQHRLCLFRCGERFRSNGPSITDGLSNSVWQARKKKNMVHSTTSFFSLPLVRQLYIENMKGFHYFSIFSLFESVWENDQWVKFVLFCLRFREVIRIWGKKLTPQGMIPPGDWLAGRVGHMFFSKECNILVFFYLLFKRTQHSCILLPSL